MYIEWQLPRDRFNTFVLFQRLDNAAILGQQSNQKTCKNKHTTHHRFSTLHSPTLIVSSSGQKIEHAWISFSWHFFY